jgi:putative ABC transport system ATP-binding protein
VNKADAVKNIFRVVNVRKYYPHTKSLALSDVSLTIEKGEFVGIKGPSGSGKSTLLYLLGGLLTPTSGQIFFQEKSLARIRDKVLYRRRNIGFVFQDFYLYPRFTALQNVLFPCMYRLIVPASTRKRAEMLLEELHMRHKRDAPVELLSAGERQRVCIARALLNEPGCILADEPTGNLDSHNGQTILEMLKKINDLRQTTVILVTHEEQVSRYAHRLIHIIDGKVEHSKVP